MIRGKAPFLYDSPLSSSVSWIRWGVTVPMDGKEIVTVKRAERKQAKQKYYYILQTKAVIYDPDMIIYSKPNL